MLNVSCILKEKIILQASIFLEQFGASHDL